jgi:peptide/nickel transport system substrate-binding protein
MKVSIRSRLLVVVSLSVLFGAVFMSPGQTAAPSKTLLIAAQDIPLGFDSDVLTPGGQQVIPQLFEPLVEFGFSQPNQTGARSIDVSAIKPRLATSWTKSSDGLKWVFSLRKGVKSSFGNIFTAADVKWSWDKSKAQGRTGNFIRNISNVQDLQVLTDNKIQFILDKPNAFFIQTLALTTPAVYDSTQMKKVATASDPWGLIWLKTNAAGFGPYYIDTYQAGTQITLNSHPNYYRPKPFFTKVIYRSVPESSIRAQLLDSGTVDWAEGLTFDQLSRVATNKNTTVRSTEGNVQTRLVMNPRFKPFDDVRVRQAVNYAISKSVIGKAVFKGYGIEMVGPVPQGFECGVKTPSYDVNYTKARELLTKAGYPNGIDVKLTYSEFSITDPELALQVQQELKKANINVELEKITNAAISSRSAITTRDIPFFVFFEQTQIPDAGYSLGLTSIPSGVANRGGYNNPVFTAGVNEANNISVELRKKVSEKRCPLLASLQSTHVEEAPWVYLWRPGAHFAMNSKVEGWVWRSDNAPRWIDLKRKF